MALSVVGEASYFKGGDRALLAVHVRDNKGASITGLSEHNFQVTQHGFASFSIYDADDIFVQEIEDYFEGYPGLYHISVPPPWANIGGQTVYYVRVTRTPSVTAEKGPLTAEVKRDVLLKPRRDTTATKTPDTAPVAEDEGSVLIHVVHFPLF